MNVQNISTDFNWTQLNLSNFNFSSKEGRGLNFCAADIDFKIICVLQETIDKDLMMCALQK